MACDRLFCFLTPQCFNNCSSRVLFVYLSGALFAAGLFTFIDSASFSRSIRNGSDVHVNIVDWLPGIFSCIGMLAANSIDKSRLIGNSYSYSGENIAWRAQLVLFMAFACLAGGLAGSVTVLIFKYFIPGYGLPTFWFGISNVLANAVIMLSSMTLWVAQKMDDGYTYNLAL